MKFRSRFLLGFDRFRELRAGLRRTNGTQHDHNVKNPAAVLMEDRRRAIPNERFAMTDHISELAKKVGAALAPKSSKTELVSFEVLRNGNISVERGDGAVFTVLARRHLPCGKDVPADIIVAEEFLEIISPLASLPLGAKPEGRRFYQRAAIAADGSRCVKFTEAGRDL